MNKKSKKNIVGVSPSSYPTTSDVSMFMKDLCYEWSNQAQVYYYNIPCKCLPRHNTIQTINRTTAEHMYKCLLGDKPYTPLKAENSNH